MLQFVERVGNGRYFYHKKRKPVLQLRGETAQKKNICFQKMLPAKLESRCSTRRVANELFDPSWLHLQQERRQRSWER